MARAGMGGRGTASPKHIPARQPAKRTPSRRQHTPTVTTKGVPIRLTGTETVVDVLSLVRQKIIDLNEASGGKGAKGGTEDTHVAQGGNPTKKKGIKAWLPDA